MEATNTVERVKKICEKKGISIHKLEKDLGFANGYIGQLKKGAIQSERLVKIADYLNVSTSYLITGEGYEIEIYNAKNAELVSMINENTDLLEVLPKYFDLSEKEKKYVIGLIELLSKS